MTAFPFGYAHYFVFASIAAGGGQPGRHGGPGRWRAEIGSRPAVFLLAGALATYLVALAVLHGLGGARSRDAMSVTVTVAALLVIAALGVSAGLSVLLLGCTLVVSLTQYLWRANRQAALSA